MFFEENNKDVVRSGILRAVWGGITCPDPLRGSDPGSNPGKRCPGLTSSFTPYYFEIVKNAVVWKYFVWSKAERQSGSNP
jgi:hypothetical protein